MPPKKSKADNGQKKAEQKKKAAKMADLTFGLKNKNKSKQVQNYVNQVETAAKMAGRSLKELKEAEARKAQRQKIKEEKERLAMENAALFKTVVTAVKQEAGPEGADPKSILCGFFKAGNCVRGKKCKYSHDLDLVRKTAKLSVYADPRETMDKWDQAKLEDVVKQKDHKTNATTIICKYFLDALESKKYGWFWECPNGNTTCQYRHCLPPGYVLKSQDKKQEEEEDDDKPTLEEEIEEERKKLDLTKCTPVTPETFAKWKEDRKKAKIADDEKKRKEAEKKGGGRGLDVLSGRALFQFDQSLFVDDADAVDADDYEIRAVEEEENKEDGKVESKNEAENGGGEGDDNTGDDNEQLAEGDDAEDDENNEGDEDETEDNEDNEKPAQPVPEPKKAEKAKAEAPKQQPKKEEPKPKAAEPKKPAAKAEQPKPKQPEAKPSAAIDESLFLVEELPDD